MHIAALAVNRMRMFTRPPDIVPFVLTGTQCVQRLAPTTENALGRKSLGKKLITVTMLLHPTSRIRVTELKFRLSHDFNLTTWYLLPSHHDFSPNPSVLKFCVIQHPLM